MRPTGRIRHSAVWLLLGIAVVAPLLFVAVRVRTPSDGARVSFYEDAWSANGVEIAPIDQPAAGLRAGDVVATIGGRSLDAWLADVANPGAARPDAAAPIRYEVLRDGQSSATDVQWSRPAIGATLVEGAGFLVFSIAFAAVGAFVLRRRPDEPSAVPLAIVASAAAGTSVPWFLGTTVSDVVAGVPFLLLALLTGPLYMLLWPAGLHLALVFPARLPVVERRPWLIPAVYLAVLGAYGLTTVAGLAATPSLVEWIATWPLAQLAVVVPVLSLTLGLFVRSFVRTADERARGRMRWAAFGAVGSGVATLGLFWVPELVSGRPLVGSAWLGIVALPFPFGLAAGILRHQLFGIDVVVNRTLVYGGLTLGVVTSYALVAAILAAIVGPEQGYGLELLATGAAALVALPMRDALQRTVNRLMYGDRDEPWRAMRRLGEVLSWTAEPDRAFSGIVRTVADGLRLPYVALEVVDGTGATTTAAEHGEAREATVELPLVHGSERVGRLVLGIRPGEAGFRPDELALLEDLARQAGAAINAIRLRADLVRSREALVLAREEERRRLRRDLHDGLGPSLAAIGMRAEASADSLETDPAGARRLLGELGDDVRVALDDVRRLVDGLRPPALDELGLLGAIEQQARRLEAGGGGASGGRSGPRVIAVEADPTPLPELPAAVEVAAYRIAVEALTNAVRHAGASTCSVQLAAGSDATLRVRVSDDGRGLPAEPTAGVGLESIRARAEELGGTLRLGRGDGGGTLVEAWLPLGTGAA